MLQASFTVLGCCDGLTLGTPQKTEYGVEACWGWLGYAFWHQLKVYLNWYFYCGVPRSVRSRDGKDFLKRSWNDLLFCHRARGFLNIEPLWTDLCTAACHGQFTHEAGESSQRSAYSKSLQVAPPVFACVAHGALISVTSSSWLCMHVSVFVSPLTFGLYTRTGFTEFYIWSQLTGYML